jgi:hypothetical protein
MDKHSYPVVDERVLAPVAPKKLLGRSPRRSLSEIPVPMAGQCLVYRTRGQYTLDSSSLPLDSPTVVEATHVSVVDLKVDNEVLIEVPLPSKDGAFFTLRVAFQCTVDDAVEVVRTGQSAVHALTGYLRGHQAIFEIGLNFSIDSINDVRRKLSAQVRAYATLSPPDVKGMTTSLTSVEVTTPEQVIKFHDRMRATKHDYEVQTEELTNSGLLDDLKDQNQQRREQRGGKHARELDAAQREHERTELQRTAESVGTDPFAVLTLAYTSGKIDAKVFADRAAEIREREIEQDRADVRDRVQFDRQREVQRWEAEREDTKLEMDQQRIALEEERLELTARNDFDRERERRRWEAEREDTRHQQEMQRRKELDRAEADHQFDLEQKRVQWEAERTDRLRDAEWAREDRQLAHERAFKENESKLELLRELAKTGQLDMLNLQLDKVIYEALGQRNSPSIESERSDERPAITPAEEQPAERERERERDYDYGDGESDDEERNTKVEA